MAAAEFEYQSQAKHNYRPIVGRWTELAGDSETLGNDQPPSITCSNHKSACDLFYGINQRSFN